MEIRAQNRILSVPGGLFAVLQREVFLNGLAFQITQWVPEAFDVEELWDDAVINPWDVPYRMVMEVLRRQRSHHFLTTKIAITPVTKKVSPKVCSRIDDYQQNIFANSLKASQEREILCPEEEAKFIINHLQLQCHIARSAVEGSGDDNAENHR